MLTDKEIQSAIRDGDEAVMGRIMVKYAKLLWGVASAVLYGNADDADVEDVVADAFVYFWEHPEEKICVTFTHYLRTERELT